MFALEIHFADDTAASEVLLVRRSVALIGSGSDAHVEIPDMKSIPYQLQIVKDLGKRFRVNPIGLGNSTKTPSWAEGVYDGEAQIDLGAVKLSIVSLDIDLQLKELEPPDRAGVRVLRAACVAKSPTFPAVVVKSDPQFVVSFNSEQTLLVGRHRHCQVRLDAPEVAERHARIGFESGEFWVEDLGSTSGTFVGGQQISGKVNVEPGISISFGRKVLIVGVTSTEQVTSAIEAASFEEKIEVSEARYPLLISQSSAARPAQIVLKPGVTVVLGRDPSCDMWLGAPHVSRRHCVVEVSKTGVVSVIDESTNGTAHARGILRKGDELQVGGKPTVLDFGAEVTVGICFSEIDERSFVSSGGRLNTFDTRPMEISAALAAPRPERKTATLFMERNQNTYDKQRNRDSNRKGGLKILITEMATEQPLLLAVSGICIIIVVLVIFSLLFPVWR